MLETILIRKHAVSYVVPELPSENMVLLLGSIILSLFADADRYEMQAASMASPMKSPHRYSPAVYSHQVACQNYFYHFFPKRQCLDILFAVLIPRAGVSRSGIIDDNCDIEK